MPISEKPVHKLTDSLLFLFISLVFLFITGICFRGFNGTDDLQYSMYSARATQHRFSPFVPTDIFCGRMAVIYGQSLVYRIFGISVFTTLAPALLATCLCAWLCCFRLMDNPTTAKILTCASLFYFTPVLSPAVQGIMPDIYITLIFLFLFLLLKKCILSPNPKRWLLPGAIAGTVTGLSLLVKENAVLFPFVFIILCTVYRKSGALRFLPAYLLSAGAIVCLIGLFYQHATGDFFFRLKQIHDTSLIENARPGACNGALDCRHLLIRITYGPWNTFIVQGYFTLVLPALLLLARLLTRDFRRSPLTLAEPAFVVILLLILYFPANFQQYQPVCSDPRQFLLLLPFGAVILTDSATALVAGKDKKRILLAVTLIAAAAILLLSRNKWKWLTYGCLSAGLLLPLVWQQSRQVIYAGCFFCLLAVTGLERLFLLKNSWFADLSRLQKELGHQPAWFPEHDNMMNWQLLQGWRNDQNWNLDPQPPPVLDLYYNRVSAVSKGWFIVNRVYTIRTAAYLNAISKLDRSRFFSGKQTVGDVSAYRIDTPGQLDSLKKMLVE